MFNVVFPSNEELGTMRGGVWRCCSVTPPSLWCHHHICRWWLARAVDCFSILAQIEGWFTSSVLGTPPHNVLSSCWMWNRVSGCKYTCIKNGQKTRRVRFNCCSDYGKLQCSVSCQWKRVFDNSRTQCRTCITFGTLLKNPCVDSDKRLSKLKNRI